MDEYFEKNTLPSLLVNQANFVKFQDGNGIIPLIRDKILDEGREVPVTPNTVVYVYTKNEKGCKKLLLVIAQSFQGGAISPFDFKEWSFLGNTDYFLKEYTSVRSMFDDIKDYLAMRNAVHVKEALDSFLENKNK